MIQVFEWINTAVSGQGVLIWGPADWFDWERIDVKGMETKWNLHGSSLHSHPKQLFGHERYTLFTFLNFFALLPKLFRGWLCQPRVLHEMGCELEWVVGWRAMKYRWRWREKAEQPCWLFRPPEPRAWCWCNRSLGASRSRRWQHLPLWRSLWPCLEIKHETCD